MSLPKGGGAIRDIGEKFAVSPATGTASLAIPVPTSPGRAGFSPSLSLTYDSGAGNGPFGLGCHASLPSIVRRTDKRLLSYQDDPDQDTFILSGAEDLVPLREEGDDGSWKQVPELRSAAGRQFAIQAYRPRVEGLFARIERWRDTVSGETHWRSISSGNVTTIYGATDESRIADPADPARVFSWLICESYDDTGNTAFYQYLAEDSAGVRTGLASERNRTRRSRSAGRYPKRIWYGNRVPRTAAGPDGLGEASREDWMFEVVFDYGDHDRDDPQPDATQPWACRTDPFSTYRPGFEIRTYRLCQRVLMFHHFPGEPGVGASCLVSSTDLTYSSADGSGLTTLASVVHTGYRRRPGGGYRAESMPPLEFGYSRPVIGHEPRGLPPGALQNLPIGIDESSYEWADLDGEGLSGVLARQGGAWFYKANLGEGRFAPVRTLATQPVAAADPAAQRLLDLAGDGHLDVAVLARPMAGVYERTADRNWRPFRPFRSQPDISWGDPQLRMIDLDGDGLADVLITGDDAFTWYPSFGYEGYGDGRRAYRPWEENDGARLMFADPEQTIYLADMSGDGLSDLVRVRNSEICYWPNLGFGRFGVKVIMDGCPWLDQPGLFDQRRVRLADVDGTGTADLVYLHPDGARLYLNQSGNGYSEPYILPQGFPQLDSLAHVMVTDLLGRGTACLVWSSPLPGDAGRQLRYIDLMITGKPYLLTEIVNNLGAETRISYAPSTQFYLADQAAGRPWITRLPFPVQVVERVETVDRINRNRFTTRHAYHHGYYDGFEREFRGFGMVETWDSEEIAVLGVTASQRDFANLDPDTDLPPVLTRTWLHTGVFPGEDRVTRLYADEYYRQPGGGDPDLPDTTLPTTLRLAGDGSRPWQLSRTEAREACRALKGSPLREEIYSLDGSEVQDQPYTVTEHNYTIELLQPALNPRPDGPQNYHAVFLTHDRETVTAHYERTLYPIHGELRTDPRITHDLVLKVDDYGNPLHVASVGYGRRYADCRLADLDQEAQRRLRLTYTESAYTNPVERLDAHRIPMPCEECTFEIIGLTPGQGEPLHQGPSRGLFGFAELGDWIATVRAEVEFQEWDVDPARLAGPARRLIAHSRVRYRRDDLSAALPLGVLEPMALPYRSYRQVLTRSLAVSLYGDRVDAGMLESAGYLRDGQTWWLPSGRVYYSPGEGDDPGTELDFARQHFFLPVRFRDPFGHTTTVTHDRYDLLVSEVRDTLANLVTVGERDASGQLTVDGNDYRVLAPSLVSDANRNRGAVAFDTLGRVCGTAVMGKPEELLGDSLEGFDPDLEPSVVAAYFADPFPLTHYLLGQASTRVLYDLDAYRDTRDARYPHPAGVAVLSRQTHASELPPGETTKVQRAFTYSDGFGHEIQHKGQAAPGPITENGPGVERRWIGSGWTVFNNKGKPVRSYEPFFTATSSFEFAPTAGVSPVLFYDPAERVIATLRPDDSYEKVLFDPWRQETWDCNDTLLLDPRQDPDVRGYAGRYLATLSAQPGGWMTWYARRADGSMGSVQQRAALQTVPHAGTPVVDWFDTMGRTFLTVAHNRVDEDGRLTDQFCRTVSLLDIQGNKHEVRDALGRAVVRYAYLMLPVQVVRAGMDIGGGGLLPDVTGVPVLAWNARGFAFRTEYDELRRPVRSHVTGPGITGDVLQSQTIYGESVADPEARNLRTRVARQYDGAGILSNEAYDFKGNLLQARRQIAQEYQDVIDWTADVPLEARDYRGGTRYDALNRPVGMTTPDASVLLPAYDQASMLDRLDGHLHGSSSTTAFIERLEYNARGQRTTIRYGNGCVTRYLYDPLTFRLVGLTTMRGSERLQDLVYAYDPVGNPTQVFDRAQSRIFFRNQVVGASARYRYDPLYRLIEATGREHLGQKPNGELRAFPPDPADISRVGLVLPGDGKAMARYRERYAYDEVGNILQVTHRCADKRRGGWRRAYTYAEPSLLQPGFRNNRLSGVGPVRAPREPGRFLYDQQGNTVMIPEVLRLDWDQNDRLRATSRTAHAGHGELGTTYYAYDAAGQRIRKVNQRAGTEKKAALRSERIYVGAFEVYREYGSDGSLAVERESLHVLDDIHRVALVDTRTAGHDRGEPQLIRYQFADHLDSAVLELDSAAKVISYEEFYPYGGTSYQSVRRLTETPKRYRFTGKERDTETGLYYHGARYYSPWLARWTNCDPAGFTDSVNLYCYVRGNPIKLTDTTGHQGSTPTLMGLWRYGVQIANRAGIGRNVQVDHPIQVAARVAQRTALSGQKFYSRAISKAAQEEGVLVETGKGLFHTELGKLQRLITQRVKAGLLASESELVAETQAAYRTAGQITNTAVNESALSRAILTNQGTIHRSLAETVQELKALPKTAGQAMASVSEDVESAFSATFQAGEKAVESIAPASKIESAAVAGASALAKSEGVVTRTAGAVARGAKALAPVARVIGKVAGPLAAIAAVAQVATAHTTAEKADAAVSSLGAAAGLVETGVGALAATAAAPVAAGAGIAGAAVVAGAFVGGKTAEAVTHATGSEAVGVGAGTLAGAATGAAIGAAIGTIVPGVGTAVGAVVGGAAGAVGGFIKSYWR